MINQKGFAPILVVTLIAVILVSGFFLYTNYSNNQTKITQPQLTTQPSPTNETANWKIYRDEEFGIEVKYPNTPYLCGETEGLPICLTGDYSHDIWIVPWSYGDGGFGVCGKNYYECVESFRDRFILLEINQIRQINSTEGIELYGTSDIGQRDSSYFGTDKERLTLIENSKKTGIFSLSQRRFSADLDKTFNQILSTFKFLP